MVENGKKNTKKNKDAKHVKGDSTQGSSQLLPSSFSLSSLLSLLSLGWAYADMYSNTTCNGDYEGKNEEPL